jgi:hypothetical protein
VSRKISATSIGCGRGYCACVATFNNQHTGSSGAQSADAGEGSSSASGNANANTANGDDFDDLDSEDVLGRRKKKVADARGEDQTK